MIQEVIVVEGKDDESAVKRAVDAEVIITNGLGIEEKTIERIRHAQKRTGVIIFTDPDFPGEKIRKIISEKVPGCKHAYLPRKYGKKGNNIGVENATPEHIREALSKVKTEKKIKKEKEIFTMEILMDAGLIMGASARKKREKIGEILGIGYANGKQFLKRLNHYQIGLEDFQKALETIEGSYI
ncbi:ribonuclease M5 [Garciella nitratireducens]|uniref:ribonuclease M5 n=1 Tax=Garciella nitratireducens TaxID=218205 RepID=UPI000DEBFCE3|nr:ribonuclease M5 [Garciella nitratireducens]RBP39888.1 RNAse M5 [Garciella nitratireducens]